MPRQQSGKHGFIGLSPVGYQTMTITPNTCIHLLPNQTSSALGNETIILNYEAGNYYELNEVAGAVWASLQAQKSILVHQINSASYWINLRSNPLYANAN